MKPLNKMESLVSLKKQARKSLLMPVAHALVNGKERIKKRARLIVFSLHIIVILQNAMMATQKPLGLLAALS